MRGLRARLRLVGWLLALALAGAAGADAGETAPSAPAPGQEVAQPSAPSTSQGMAMICPMMAGMNMASTNTSGLSMNHGTSPSATLTDLAQNVSMRDILQIVQELVAVQERVLETMSRKQAAGIRRDVDRLKERSRELMTEIRGMVSAAARGE